MKIAIAYWQDRISPVFDVSDRLCLIDIEDGKEVKREIRILTSRDPFNRAREVSGFGTDVLICGAVSRALEMALTDAGIQVAGFMCGDLDAVLSAFLCGQLTDDSFFMPGCYGEQRRRRFRSRHRRH
jgi:predicted Fe-Mo cluster-binding NifX family protein